jgi:hypothetical protein
MSMVLSGIPDPQAQVRSLQQELYNRNRQISDAETRIADLEAELVRERAKSRQVERGAQQLRSVLSPLYQALGAVFGEMDAAGMDDSSPVPTPGKSPSPVWESWKSRLGGASSRIIDILLMHGELNQEQIRIHIGTNRKQTIYDAIAKLNKAGIINKRDGKVSLKELA